MQLSQRGKAKLKVREGYSGKAYYDTGRVPTIGHGTIRIDGQPVKMGMTCTPEQAESWMMEDVYTTEKAINDCALELTQNQYDALVSFVYNIGISAFLKSTMLRKLRDGDASANAELDRWVLDQGVRVAGLVNRRRDEREQFNTA